jgi:C-terminal processing protease CtpA/Prc
LPTTSAWVRRSVFRTDCAISAHGLVVRDGKNKTVCVAKVVEGSEAARMLTIRPGDRLAWINGR